VIRTLILWSLLFIVGLCEGVTLDSLLNRLAIEEDLSRQTIQESAGSVIVFTREDLDRMQIKSLAEVIEKIPFIRYNENEYGLIDPGYHPFQPATNNIIRIYVDDREIVDGMGTSGLQLFSQMDLDYIDHIEIYFGAVSFSIAMEPSLAIIKLYTKEPSRENANILNLSFATYGTHDFNFYSAQELQDYSYLLYYDHKEVKRPKYFVGTTPLSRDKHIDMVYGKIQKGPVRLEFNLLNGGYDSFLARALSLQPKDPKTYLKNIYTGISYKAKGWKAFSSLSYYNLTIHSRSDLVQGLFPIDRPPYFAPYKEMDLHIHEMVLDGEVSKQIRHKRLELLLGARGRFRHTDFLRNRYDQWDVGAIEYTGDKTLSPFLEVNYLFDESNIFTLSAKRDYVYESVVDNYQRNAIRIGYIRNTQNYTLKLFGIKTGFVPQPILFIEQNIWGKLDNPLDQERAKIVAIELLAKRDMDRYGFMYNRAYYENFIVYDFERKELYNSQIKQQVDALFFRFHHYFDPANKLILRSYIGVMERKKRRYYRGGDLTLYNQLEPFKSYLSLVYRSGYPNLKAGYNLNMALTFEYSRRLNLYLKGINLLGKALRTNYYGFDIFQQRPLVLPNVDVIDRTLWVGMEYQF